MRVDLVAGHDRLALVDDGTEGVGARYERVLRGRLPYRLRYVITVTGFDPPRESAWDSEGDLSGEGGTC